MKSMLIGLALIVFVLVGVAGWKMRPLTPVGRANRLGNWKFEDCEMQIWQTKKAVFSEPFSTSLYVRFQTNEWHQYYLDHQDYYGSHYHLTETNGIVSVTRAGKAMCTVTISTGNYERAGGGVGLEAVFWRNPP